MVDSFRRRCVGVDRIPLDPEPSDQNALTISIISHYLYDVPAELRRSAFSTPIRESQLRDAPTFYRDQY
jgi:hypothetical protein